jgi:hypothetical protein
MLKRMMFSVLMCMILRNLHIKITFVRLIYFDDLRKKKT